MKKEYSKPAMRVVELKHRCQLLSVSSRSIQSVGSNADIYYGGSDDECEEVIIK